MTVNKPSTLEDEYFVREDAERLRALHLQEQRRLSAQDKEALRQLHHGRCAECGAQLVPEKVGEIIVHHCPSCGGAFLTKSAWERLHTAAEPHTLMGAVLNWFKSANKP